MTSTTAELKSNTHIVSLTGKNILVYDLEIKNPIETLSRGWDAHDEMGISVGCAFDYRDMRYRVFMDDNILQLVERMNEPNTLIVAFNHIHFDNRLLRASGLPLKPDHELKQYDMLLESREGAGCKGPQKGFKLDEHLKTLRLPMKTANGAMAPIMWQGKRYGELIDYCLNDVTQEKALFEHIVFEGYLACGFKNGIRYNVRKPQVDR